MRFVEGAEIEGSDRVKNPSGGVMDRFRRHAFDAFDANSSARFSLKLLRGQSTLLPVRALPKGLAGAASDEKDDRALVNHLAKISIFVSMPPDNLHVVLLVQFDDFASGRANTNAVSRLPTCSWL